MSRTKIFVSYSHKDLEWLVRFTEHVSVLERQGLIDLWSDTRIVAGAEWENEIDDALTAAKVAVLLVSPPFLASYYIWEHEMPRIIAHSKQGMNVLPLIVRPCAWRLEEELARFQARPADGRPLSLGSESQVDSDLMAFTNELAAQIGRSRVTASVEKTGSPLAISVDEVASVSGEWAGNYNGTRPVHLRITEVRNHIISGAMEYAAEGTITHVKGSIHTSWSPNDPIWAQLGGVNYQDRGVAVSFRETDYEKKGSSSISFDGEYHAFVSGDEMTGAWFSGQRLVGSLVLQRVVRQRPTRGLKRRGETAA